MISDYSSCMMELDLADIWIDTEIGELIPCQRIR